MVKKYAKYYFIAFAVFLAVFLSARPWQWLVSSADEQSFRTLRIEKVWDDDGNVDGIRPESVKMKIFQNGTLWREVTVTKEDGWKLSVTDAPEADEDGNAYDYTVKEEVPAGYTASVARSMQDKYPVVWKNGVDGSEIKSMDLNTLEGIDGLYPEAPAVDGYEFKEWSSPVLTDGIYVITAEYEEAAKGPHTITVNFVDQDDMIIKTASMQAEHNDPYDAAPLLSEKPDGYETMNPQGDSIAGVADTDKEIKIPVYEGDLIDASITVAEKDVGYIGSEQCMAYRMKWTLTNTSNIPLYGMDTYMTFEYRKKDGVTVVPGGQHSFVFADGTAVPILNELKGTLPYLTTDTIYHLNLKNGDEALNPGESIEFYFWSLVGFNRGASTWQSELHYFTNFEPSTAAASVFSMPDAAAARFAAFAADPEAASAVYDSAIDFTVTNLHEPVERMSFEITAKWDDGDDADGVRPEHTNVYLLKDEDFFDVINLYPDSNGDLSANAANLMKYDPITGERCEYDLLIMTAPNGYEAEVNGFTIVYHHDLAHEENIVSALFEDEDDADEIRPEELVVNILCDGEPYKEVTLAKDEDWKTDVGTLPGDWKHAYTLSADAPDGYTVSVDGLTVTASHEVFRRDIPLSMTWDDGDNVDEIRPESFGFNLLLNGELYDQPVLTAEEDFTKTLTVPDRNPYTGEPYVYTLEVPANPDGYAVTVNDMSLTGTHVPAARGSITFTARWDDNDDEDGIRPESLSGKITVNGADFEAVSFDAEHGWTAAFDNLLMADPVTGEAYVYAVSQSEDVPGYASSVDGYTLKNTHTPVAKVPGVVSITWDDGDDADSLRPDTFSVDVLRNGEIYKTAALNAENGWSVDLGSLPAADPITGESYSYALSDVAGPEGYTASVSGLSITFTHISADRTSFTVSVAWDDGDDKDCIRPESAALTLLRDGEPFDAALLSDENGWSKAYNNLKSNGENGGYLFSVTWEEPPAGYDVSIGVVDGNFVATAVHVLKPDPVIPEGSVGIIWNDGDNVDGLRPESYTANLLQNGEVYSTIELNAASGWQAPLENLPDVDDEGNPYVYAVEAANGINGYDLSVDGFVITAVHVPGQKPVDPPDIPDPSVVSVKAGVVWNDGDDKDKARPESVVIKLYRNGAFLSEAQVTAVDGWSHVFAELPEFDENNGKYAYTVSQDAPAGYETSVSGFTITNTRKTQPDVPAEKTSVSFKVTWDDQGNKDKLRPDAFDVIVYRDGQVFDQVTLKQANGWSYKYDGLLKYASDGHAYAYSIGAATQVSGYDVSVSGQEIICRHIPKKEEPKPVKPEKPDKKADGSSEGTKTAEKQQIAGKASISKDPKRAETLEVVKTGQNNFLLMGLFGALVLSGCGFMLYKRRKR